MTNNTYDSKDIVVLEGLDAVRLRPGMYIGTTGPKGFHHLLWEIVDNSIDEISNGFGDTITITLNKDGSATVQDNGRGIPVDIHPTLKNCIDFLLCVDAQTLRSQQDPSSPSPYFNVLPFQG